jgi:hypothetical protein
MDATDRRAGGIAGWIVALLLGFAFVADQRGLHWIQAVEWPTDLYTLGRLQAEPIDVAVVGTSRSHYGLPPSAIDLYLSRALGRRTRSVGLNRLTASAYTEDIVARELLTASPPKVLVVEVAPETLNAHHFEQDYNIGGSIQARDVPECLATARSTTRLATCSRPLFRGVENVAHLLARPFGDHAHITWMATYEGGGQYCYEDDACRARNAAYDERAQGRWQSRMDTVIPEVRAQRFTDYQIREGLGIDHFRALLDRETARGVHVVVVNLPVAAVYQAEVPEAVYAEFLSVMHDELHPRGVPFVDLNTPAMQADRDAFLDPDHLNRVGAERITRALCEGTIAGLVGG